MMCCNARRKIQAEAENARLQTRVEEAEAKPVCDSQVHCLCQYAAASKVEKAECQRDGDKALAKLREEALKEIEWCGGVGGLRQCPRCNMSRSLGHAHYCPLAAAIDATPEDALKREKERAQTGEKAT